MWSSQKRSWNEIILNFPSRPVPVLPSRPTRGTGPHCVRTTGLIQKSPLDVFFLKIHPKSTNSGWEGTWCSALDFPLVSEMQSCFYLRKLNHKIKNLVDIMQKEIIMETIALHYPICIFSSAARMWQTPTGWFTGATSVHSLSWSQSSRRGTRWVRWVRYKTSVDIFDYCNELSWKIWK